MMQTKDENDQGDWAKGTYHHWDGYPNGAVHETIKEGFKDKGWEYVEDILKHSWSAIWNGDCHCCGTMDDGRKEDVSYLPLEPKDDMGAEYMYVFAREEGKDYLKIYESNWNSSDWKKIETTELKNNIQAIGTDEGGN
tara:strand:+ start:70 stop:483 length:414 start_codon:yes stop_codon:yes gene_type:complete